MRSFASDNYSGVHPKIFKALEQAAVDHQPAYGRDSYTKQAIDLLQKEFGKNCDIYFVFNGTGANVLGLKTVLSSYNSVLCAGTAHLNVDECGAPENAIGCKLQTVKTADGKLTPELLSEFFYRVGDEHYVQAKAISISQVTELGTVYTVDEIKRLAKFAHEKGLLFHMDGARLANAAASLNVGLKEITFGAGVDILSLGGTKNGLMFGEAVLFSDKVTSSHFKYIRKQGMQLASKMRFISAQFIELFTDELWLKNAKHANACAKKLAEKVSKIKGVEIKNDIQANSVFAVIPKEWITKLQEQTFFYVWDEATSLVRWMTSFDTTDEDIDHFVQALKRMN